MGGFTYLDKTPLPIYTPPSYQLFQRSNPDIGWGENACIRPPVGRNFFLIHKRNYLHCTANAFYTRAFFYLFMGIIVIP
jgi:hypothetical protein